MIASIHNHSGQEALQGFLRGAAFSACGLVIGGFLTMAAGIALTRWLGPEGFGVYSVALAVVTAGATCGAGGMDYAVARFVAYYLGAGKHTLVRGVIRYTLGWSLILSSALFGTVALVALGGPGGYPAVAKLTPYWMPVGLAIPLIAIQSVMLQAILATHAVKTRVFLEKIVLPFLRLGLPFALLLVFTTRTAAAVASVPVGALLLVGVTAAVLHRRVRSLPECGPVSPPVKREWSAFALPYVFFSIQSFLSSGLGIDVLLVGALSSMLDSGIYAACFRFTLVLLLARAGMDYAIGPRIGALCGRSDISGIRQLYQVSSSVGLAWTLPWAVALMLYSDWLMSLFFGPLYARGGAALAILAIGFAIDGAAGCNATLLSMIGRPWLVFANGISGGVLAIALCFLLIPAYGMVGAAAAVTVARCTSAILGTVEIWRIYRIHPLRRSSGKLLIAAALATALGQTLRSRIGIEGAQAFLLLSGMIAAVFVCYAAVLGISRFSIAPAES